MSRIRFLSNFTMLNGKPLKETLIDLTRVIVFIVIVYYLIEALVGT